MTAVGSLGINQITDRKRTDFRLPPLKSGHLMFDLIGLYIYIYNPYNKIGIGYPLGGKFF